MSELAGKVGEVARKAKEEGGTAAKDEKLSLEHLKQEASSAAAGIKQDREASAQKKVKSNLTSAKHLAGWTQLSNSMEEYPLAVGIGFAALGALVGVLLPRTRLLDTLRVRVCRRSQIPERVLPPVTV